MKNKTKTQVEIIEGARELFYKKGFRKVSMDELADYLKMSKKTIYNYYSSKSQLIESIFEEYRISIALKIDQLISDPSLSFSEKLKGMMAGVAYALSGMSSIFLQDIEYHMPALWKKVNQYKNEAAYLRFNRLMEEGIKNGHIRKEVNKSVVVALYASAIHNLLDPRFLSSLPESIMLELPEFPSEIFDNVMNIIYKGILYNGPENSNETGTASEMFISR
jgi:AcrR family transcriptional regulator